MGTHRHEEQSDTNRPEWASEGIAGFDETSVSRHALSVEWFLFEMEGYSVLQGSYSGFSRGRTSQQHRPCTSGDGISPTGHNVYDYPTHQPRPRSADFIVGYVCIRTLYGHEHVLELNRKAHRDDCRPSSWKHAHNHYTMKLQGC